MSASQSQLNYTQSMYIAYYGRAADPGGLGYWVGRLGVEGAAGIAAAFGNSAEFNENYGALSNTELVNGLFLQLFGRAADTGGLAFYSAGLESGEFTLPDVALRIIDGVRPGSGDDLIVANRVDVANVVTNLAPTSPLRDSILDAVGGDSRSVDTALESLGITLEDRGRFNLTIGESDGKVGIDSAVLLTPRTAESGDILGLDVLRADPRFANIDGSGYTVVVLDTGIDLNHPAFGPDSDGDGVSDRIVYHQDFSDDGDGTADDVNGHGSNVASIIGSSSGAFEGVAPGVNIIALQVLGNAGGGSFDGIQRALQWVVENQSAFNIVAVNLSLGTSTNANSPQLDVLADEFAALAALGVISIAAAGNDYFSFQAPGVGYPASDPNVIAVGATFDANVGPQGWADGAEAFSTAVDVIVPFSQRSTLLTPIFAPGATITGAAPGGGTAGQTGTSQAAPQIAGVAALAQQIADQELGRRLSPTEFLSLLSSSAVTIVDGDDENDNVLNSGASFSRVDVVALANAIASLDDGAAPAPAPTQDAIPGDTTTQATLVLGEVTQGAIDSREDRDWFRVDLEAGENYAFSLNGVTLSDPWLGLFDPAGVFITSNNDAGGTSNSALSFTPTASGTFFLSAEAFSASQTGSYVIEALLATFANSDGIPGDASSSEALAVNASVSSSIDFGGDQDWLLLDLQAGVTYTIDVSGSTSGGGTLMDPTLEVFSSASEAVAFNDDGGPGLEPSLIFTPNASGSFFAAVRAFGADDTGSYTVSISADEDVDAIPGDASTGATLVAGENLTNSIDFADDQDWFAVTLTAGEQYEFNLTGDGPNALADPFLALFDANGGPEALAIDDDGGDGRNARLAFAPDSTGTYFVAASA
ncbi:MAG: subtilisin family serine protease, partial [Halieaceae bacterium]